jgi:hypothetical protein
VEYGSSPIDLLNVTGLLDITGGFVDFGQVGGALDGVNPYIFGSYGSLTGTFTELNVPDGYQVDYGVGTSSVLSLAVVPEPATALLGGLGMLVLLRRRKS